MTPAYGISADPRSGEWSEIAGKIEASRNYWICTTRKDGRPHAMPVWGVWLDGALYFSTDPNSVKGRNLRRTGQVVVHLESGDDAVIIEGTIEQVTDRATLTAFADVYNTKYQFRPDPDDPNGLTVRVVPSVANTWLERDFPNSATRWEF